MEVCSSILTELASAFSHLGSTKTHQGHCLICDTFYFRTRFASVHTRSGLRLLPTVLPTEIDLIQTGSTAERTAVFYASGRERWFVELQFAMSIAGFTLQYDNVTRRIYTGLLCLFVDVRTASVVPQLPPAPRTTVLLLGMAAPLPKMRPGMTIIHCRTPSAVRAFVLYSQRRHSRFTVFELMSAFAAEPEVTITSSTNCRITSVLI